MEAEPASAFDAGIATRVADNDGEDPKAKRIRYSSLTRAEVANMGEIQIGQVAADVLNSEFSKHAEAVKFLMIHGEVKRSIFLKLNHEKLRELGMTVFGPRDALVNFVNNLNEAEGAGSPSKEVAPFFDALETLAYEAMSSQESALEPREGPEAVFAPRLVSVIISALTKLGTKFSEFSPRVVQCLLTMQRHYDTDFGEGVEYVRDRLAESLQLLCRPAVANLVFIASDRLQSRSALSCLSHLSHSPAAFTPGCALHEFQLSQEPPGTKDLDPSCLQCPGSAREEEAALGSLSRPMTWEEAEAAVAEDFEESSSPR